MKHPSLNPFSFRAGVLHLTQHEASAEQRLNPFSFRAGVLHSAPREFLT